MSWTLCTSGAAIYKSGVSVNSDIKISGAILAAWSDLIEGTINNLTRKDWIANAPPANFSGALAELASDMIATKMISYDTNGYTKREAELMLDVLENNIQRNLKALEKSEYRENLE